MNKLAIIPIFFLTMCGTAPITDDPAHAQEPDVVCQALGCDKRDLILIPRQELRGEIDIYEPMHWHQMQMMFQKNMNKGRIEQTATKPADAINSALMEFNNGSNGSTKQEELLQLSGDGD